MKIKPVERVFAPAEANMVGDGFRVHNFFPNGYRIGHKRMSPFFLLDYNAKINFAPTDKLRGVGVHPHRGFETVTIAYEGAVAHHDSHGGSGVIRKGEVQWMTTASGVLHKEYHDEAYSRAGGPFQMVQLWVNLPAKDKMNAPKYQAITREKMKRHALGEAGYADIIAGNFKGETGSASTFTPIEMYNLYLKKGGETRFDLPAQFNTGLLVIEGSVTVNGEKVPADHFALFKNEGEDIALHADEDSIVLVLSGEPINEPLTSYGPFVMNTQDEIRQAFDDYNQGKFGYLDED